MTIMPYANIAITLCLAGIMGVRHAKNARRIERFNVELQEAITTAQAELASTLKQQYGLALTNTRLRDHLQLAHDLHDGLGGSFSILWFRWNKARRCCNVSGIVNVKAVAR